MKRTARYADHSILIENAAAPISVVIIKCTVNDADAAGVIVEASAERLARATAAIKRKGATSHVHRSGVVINAPALGGSGAVAAHKVVDKRAVGDVDRTTI